MFVSSRSVFCLYLHIHCEWMCDELNAGVCDVCVRTGCEVTDFYTLPSVFRYVQNSFICLTGDNNSHQTMPNTHTHTKTHSLILVSSSYLMRLSNVNFIFWNTFISADVHVKVISRVFSTRRTFALQKSEAWTQRWASATWTRMMKNWDHMKPSKVFSHTGNKVCVLYSSQINGCISHETSLWNDTSCVLATSPSDESCHTWRRGHWSITENKRRPKAW